MVLQAVARGGAFTLALACALSGALAACSGDADPGPGGVTQGEARALDDAARMLDSRPRPPLVDATIPPDLASEAAEP